MNRRLRSFATWMTVGCLSGAAAVSSADVVFKGVQVHNVAALVAEPDGRQAFRRVGLAADAALCDLGRRMNAGNTGVELRFVLKGDSVRIRLGGTSDASHSEIWVYHGDIIGDWPEMTKSVHGRDGEIVVRRVKNLSALKAEARRRGDRFDPEVVRLVLPLGDLGLRDVVGDVEPPPPSMLPKTTYLAYGSSITHGSNALTPETCWAGLVGAGLGADVRNLGFAGSARLEGEVADFIAGESFDVATLELGVNALGVLDEAEFERRARYFIRRVAESHPQAKVLVTDVFGNRTDGATHRQAAAFRAIVGRVTDELKLPNVAYANGLDLLPDNTDLSSGSLHPAPAGHVRIAQQVLRRLSEGFQVQQGNKGKQG